MSSVTEWARYSPSDDFWLVATVLIILSVVGFFGAFYFFMRKRIIEDTPTSKIRSAAQGYLELVGIGELMDGPPIVSPLTGTHCVWFSYKIEERRRSGKNSRWVTIEKRTSDELFLLKDDTGACVIDPEGASVTTSISDTWYGSTARPIKNKTSSSIFSSGRYRYTEKRLHMKDILYAIGLYKTVGGAGGYFNPDEDVRDLIKEWKQDSEKLLKQFDKDKDGQISMEEWQAVRDAAYKEVMDHHDERKTVMPVNMMTRTCDRKRPYILSALPEDKLLRHLQYYSVGLICLFFTAGGIATWLIGLRTI